jgi:heat shock protein beta
MPPFDPNQEMNAQKLHNIKLFVKRVFISDEFGEDLLPRYLSFVKGVVDSSDLPLNVSREILQEGRVVRVMKKRLVRKTLDMLDDLAKAEDVAAFNTFHDNFGRNLKLGVIEDKDNAKTLAELIRFSSSQSGDSVTSLADYKARMPEEQKSIYFVAATSKEAAAKSPFIEGLLKKNMEVLYLLEPIDEVGDQSVTIAAAPPPSRST